MEVGHGYVLTAYEWLISGKLKGNLILIWIRILSLDVQRDEMDDDVDCLLAEKLWQHKLAKSSE